VINILEKVTSERSSCYKMAFFCLYLVKMTSLFKLLLIRSALFICLRFLFPLYSLYRKTQTKIEKGEAYTIERGGDEYKDEAASILLRVPSTHVNKQNAWNIRTHAPRAPRVL